MPVRKEWRLVVWNVGPEHSGLMARLKLVPAQKTPTTFWRAYPFREHVLEAIALLKSAGLHGVAKHVELPQKAKSERPPPPWPSREGFGGRLNAKPVASSWRRKRSRVR